MMATEIYRTNINREAKYTANAVVDYMEKNGQWNRAIYDDRGYYAQEVHSGPHYSKRQLTRHPPDGAHMHDHDERGIRYPDKPGEDGYTMTEADRREHNVLFKRRKTRRDPK